MRHVVAVVGLVAVTPWTGSPLPNARPTVMCVGSATAQSKLIVAEVFEIVMRAAGFLAGHARR